jgi:hypothetical protein
MVVAKKQIRCRQRYKPEQYILRDAMGSRWSKQYRANLCGIVIQRIKVRVLFSGRLLRGLYKYEQRW